MRFLKTFSFAVALATFLPLASADVRLPKIFGDHMVLQGGTEVNIWGWADPSEEVKVELGDTKANASAGADGKWALKVKTPPAAKGITLVVKGKNTIEIKDVLIGEVWVASGQSNMEWTVAQSKNPREEAQKAFLPSIRMIKVRHTVSDSPQDDITPEFGGWQVCSPETAPQFSASAYFFARDVQSKIDKPIGIISTNWGGTLCEAWTSNGMLKSDEDFAPILDRGAKFDPNNPNQPSVLYNGMLHPILKYGIRGAIWYQGESNLGRAEQYGELFPAMIQDWRKGFGQGDFPFYFVQIAPFAYDKNGDTAQLPELWEAQQEALKLPNTGMASTTDIGDVNDIHPTNKQDVGSRLARWALAKTYGRTEVDYAAPTYLSMTIEGSKARISFNNAAGGFVYLDRHPLTWFTICGEDKKFVPASARIDGETVVVWNDAVEKPVAVRFGWSDVAEPNLFAKNGLPVTPFRTDSFPKVTAGKR